MGSVRLPSTPYFPGLSQVGPRYPPPWTALPKGPPTMTSQVESSRARPGRSAMSRSRAFAFPKDLQGWNCGKPKTFNMPGRTAHVSHSGLKGHDGCPAGLGSASAKRVPYVLIGLPVATCILFCLALCFSSSSNEGTQCL